MPKQQVAYVVGPFRAESHWEIEQNIRRAEAYALELWLQGYAVICPHTNTRFYQGAAPDEVWLTGDLEILSRCDIIAMLLGWEKSSGSVDELKKARECGLLEMYQQGGD